MAAKVVLYLAGKSLSVTCHTETLAVGILSFNASVFACSQALSLFDCGPLYVLCDYEPVKSVIYWLCNPQASDQLPVHTIGLFQRNMLFFIVVVIEMYFWHLKVFVLIKIKKLWALLDV